MEKTKTIHINSNNERDTMFIDSKYYELSANVKEIEVKINALEKEQTFLLKEIRSLYIFLTFLAALVCLFAFGLIL